MKDKESAQKFFDTYYSEVSHIQTTLLTCLVWMHTNYSLTVKVFVLF